MSSTRQTMVTTGVGVYDEVASILWKIHNFPLVQQDKSLVAKQEFEFKTGETSSCRSRWKIGLRKSSSSNIGMYFTLLQSERGYSSGISVKIVVHLKATDGSTLWTKQQVETVSQENHIYMNDMLRFNQAEDWWTNLVDSDNALTFEIKIETLLEKAKTSTLAEKKISPHSTSNPKVTEDFKQMFIQKSQQNYAALLADDSSSDVKIVCSDGKEIPAHCLVLAAQCPVFRSMLSPDSKFSESKNGIIEVKEVSGKTMGILLHYFYTGEVQPTWSDSDTILEFTYAAGKYQLKEVLKMLDAMIGTGSDLTCSMGLLSLVTKLGLKNAESQLVQRIVKRTSGAKTGADLFAIYEDLK